MASDCSVEPRSTAVALRSKGSRQRAVEQARLYRGGSSGTSKLRFNVPSATEVRKRSMLSSPPNRRSVIASYSSIDAAESSSRKSPSPVIE
ncbi:hypothetical protein G6F21_014317 [Rhizopus arrhizus]|nr:hypothetical protein G6F21_014317 [Rhizopus arrhizus]